MYGECTNIHFVYFSFPANLRVLVWNQFGLEIILGVTWMGKNQWENIVVYAIIMGGNTLFGDLSLPVGRLADAQGHGSKYEKKISLSCNVCLYIFQGINKDVVGIDNPEETEKINNSGIDIPLSSS